MSDYHSYRVPYDGEYTGIWGGHVLKINYFGGQLTKETIRGVRGINIPVRLRVENGRVLEDSITPVNEGGQDDE